MRSLAKRGPIPEGLLCRERRAEHPKYTHSLKTVPYIWGHHPSSHRCGNHAGALTCGGSLDMAPAPTAVRPLPSRVAQTWGLVPSYRVGPSHGVSPPGLAHK